MITQVSGGMAGDIYAIRHFKWEGLDVVPIFAEEQDYDRDHDLFIRTRVTNIDNLAGPTVVSEILTAEEIATKREKPE